MQNLREEDHKMKNVLIIVFVMTSQALFGHSANELTCTLENRSGQWELLLETTPQSVLDMVVRIHPELRHESFINPEDYQEGILVFLEETIELSLDGKNQTYQIVATDLDEHNATIRLKLRNAPNQFSNYKLRISCYDQIYSNPIYVFKIRNGEQLTTRILYTDSAFVSGEMEEKKSSFLIWGSLTLFLGAVTLMFFFDSIQKKFKPAHRKRIHQSVE